MGELLMAKKNLENAKKLMESLGISEAEALELIAFDNDEVENEEVEAIESNMKEAAASTDKPKTAKKGSSLDKVKNQKAKKKVDAAKEDLMTKINAMLVEAGVVAPQNLTSSKVSFMVGDEFFSISLTKHKAKPDGFDMEKVAE